MPHDSIVFKTVARIAAALLLCASAAPAAFAAADAAAPDPQLMLKPLPLSTPAGSPTPLSAAAIEAGASPIAQVLGSSANGTVIKAYTVTHMRASDLQALLADINAPLLPRETSAIMVDLRSNSLLVKGTDAEHQIVENLIRRIDVLSKQVLVEVKIVSADEFFGKSLGAKFGVTRSRMLGPATPQQQGTQVGGNVGDLNQIATTGTSAFPPNVSLGASNALTSAPVAALALGFFKLPAGVNIGLEISALEEAGHTKILSEPKLVLGNLKPGLISSGQRVPYSKPSLVQGVNTTEFVDVKVSVSVTALVAPDGTISLDLSLTDDTVGANSPVGPTINTNQATSNVTLQSGETLLLGGFRSQANGQEKNQVPVVGSLPFIGGLFRNQVDNSVKRELLFIITPTIIEPQRL